MFELGAAARFIAASDAVVPGGFAIFGAPYDGTASYRPGSRFAPAAIRAASDGLETYSPKFDADLEDVGFADVGDLPAVFGPPKPALSQVSEAVSALLNEGAIPLMLGGEHSLTAPAFHAVRTAHPDVVLLQLDAHADLRDNYLGEPNSHACAMRRSLDGGETELIQFGIRSGTRTEWQWMRGNDTLYDLERLEARLSALTAPLYLTVDLDVFDPSLMPGTGTPEPGGIDWATFERIAHALWRSSARIVGLDVMELAPRLDPTGVSDIVAAKVVRELVLSTQ